MALVSLSDVKSARALIAGKAYLTPTVRSKNLSALLGVELYLKLEPMQKTGSFKVRGAINKIAALTPDERKRGVVTISAGNHAQGVAWAATNAGVKSTFVMPADAVRSKVEATRAYGGEVFQTGGVLMDTLRELQAERGLTFVPPFDDPAIIAGAGTVTDEIIDDMPDVDAIVFSIGGGGLASGAAVVARARRPSARLIGVEPTGASAMRQSLDKGEPVTLNPLPKTLADGLAAPFAGAITLEHVREHGVEVYVLPDEPIISAMWLLIERTKVVAEPAAAAGLAALLEKIPQPALAAGSKVICIVSGGNVDRERLKTLA
ncbi:MAG: threonine/serine dehydratase [Gemmatimonadetes bacterium]|nr:threonine/serine dehydratase [Gemmatimonadota bacterium]